MRKKKHGGAVHTSFGDQAMTHSRQVAHTRSGDTSSMGAKPNPHQGSAGSGGHTGAAGKKSRTELPRGLSGKKGRGVKVGSSGGNARDLAGKKSPVFLEKMKKPEEDEHMRPARPMDRGTTPSARVKSARRRKLSGMMI